MPHGTPDWWGTEPTETIYPLQDVGELAARLGSIDTFDRRGNVIWLSGFESGLGGFVPSTSGTGAAVVVSTTTARTGPYSCKLTAGSDVLELAAIQRFVSYPVLSRFGGEFAFTWDTGIDRLRNEMLVYDGSNLTTFSIRLDETNSKIYYLNSGGGWTEFAALPAWGTEADLFHVGKLVVDLDLGEYVRFILDDTEHDLSGNSGKAEVDATYPHINFSARLTGPGGTNPSIYIDDMIVTQNES